MVYNQSSFLLKVLEKKKSKLNPTKNNEGSNKDKIGNQWDTKWTNREKLVTPKIVLWKINEVEKPLVKHTDKLILL